MEEEQDSKLKALMEGRLKAEALSEEQQEQLHAHELEQIIKATDRMQLPAGQPKAQVWEAISNRISTLTKQEVAPLPEPHDTQPVVRSLQDANWKRGLPLAAGIGLLLLSTLYFFLLRDITEQSLAGEIKQVELPDGSLITLSPMSSITYAVKSWGKRNVYLEGEAYFDVASGADAFAVHTPHFTVEVLGTEFNVSSRAGQELVACSEGQVAVYAGDKVQTLQLGEAVQLRKAQFTSSPYTVKPSAVGAWQQGIFQFEDVSLSLVLQEVERHFNVQINDTSGSTARYTGTFTKQELEEVLTVICVPLGLRFTQHEEGVTIYQP